MGENATFLTEKYPGQEKQLWIPCIYNFFQKIKPKLSVSKCIESPSQGGPWYESRQKSPFLHIEGDILMEPIRDDFLEKISTRFGIDLIGLSSGRITATGDITGIGPDIIIIKPNKQGIYIIEIKPYSWSSFTGNQEYSGAYLKFINWLNYKNIPCEYFVVKSIGCTPSLYENVLKIQKNITNHFGILLLEDIFSVMDKTNFEYPDINEKWGEYSDKGFDYR